MGTPPADLAAAERGSVAMTISCRGASDIPASYPSPVISLLNANRNGLIVLRFRKILQSSEVLKFCQRTSKELQKGLILILTISKAVLCISKLDLFCFVLFYISSTNMTKTQWKVTRIDFSSESFLWSMCLERLPPGVQQVLSSLPASSPRLSNALDSLGSNQGWLVIEMCLEGIKARPKSSFHTGHQWDVRWGFLCRNELCKFLTSLVWMTGPC